MREVINSVGIDIGTSTTQLIFSKLTIQNMATSYTVPRITIVKTQVVYSSEVYFTPLKSPTVIDVDAVKRIIQGEYDKACMRPDELQTGAVIITGETARKENAEEVLSALSDMAGDFVVATAGPDLESVLSAKGAGTNVMSKEDRNIIANIDIGGGTSNIAVFNKGDLVGTSCLDIGGRLIEVSNGKICYIFDKMQKLSESQGVPIRVGDSVDTAKLKKLAKIMARHLAMALGLVPKDALHKELYTNEGLPLPDDICIDGVTFSGGVAEVVYNPEQSDPFKYNDLGILLGQAIAESEDFDSIKQYDSIEKIRATVVGAGTQTTEVSGSTIRYNISCLPIKNVPVVRMTADEEEDLNLFPKRLAKKIEIFTGGSKDTPVAIGLCGDKYKTFDRVQDLADAIVAGLESYDKPNVPVLVVVENDIGKVLGNALQLKMGRERKIICVDSIFVKDGDYVDIGEPVASGRVVPVVTKTLIFNR